MAIEIKIASSLGFCFGVRRAIEMVEDTAREKGPIDSLGSVVHNPVVVERLRSEGVETVAGFESVSAPFVAITAHGAGPEVYRTIQRRGLDLVDTTCPIVAKAQRAARRLVNEGFKVIIYGDEHHPEVRGVLAWTKGKGVVLADSDRPIAIPRRKVALLSQTTKSEAAFTQFIARFLTHNLEHINEVRIINTTCPETEERYEAARRLAGEVDLMIVIGGRNSANTAKLAAVCRATGSETYQVERESDIDPAWLRGKRVVGITAGASTPDESVRAVIERLRELEQLMETQVIETREGAGVR